jgi:hypothetical protein
MACRFDMAHLRELLYGARDRFEPLLFAEADERERTPRPALFLRHDIDHSLADALPVARLEAECGLRSTYFGQLHCPFYAVTDAAGRDALREIVALGHEIGFHYDLAHYRGGVDEMRRAFEADLALLGSIAGKPVPSAARHDPAASSGVPALRPGEFGLQDAYAPEFISEILYISDSSCRWRSGCWCQHQGSSRPMQVLLHPVWWVHDDEAWEDKLRRSSAREQERLARLCEETIVYYQRSFEERTRRDARFRERATGE